MRNQTTKKPRCPMHTSSFFFGMDSTSDSHSDLAGKQKGPRSITGPFPSSANSTALECGLVTEKIIHGRIETWGRERLRQRSATIEEVAENPQRIRDINASIIIGIS